MTPFSPKKYPNCADGHQYALDVTEGRIVACKYIIGACQRYLRMVGEDSPKHYFDPERAEKYLRLTQRFKHVIGVDWKTENITYEPWQKFIWMNIMGFVNRDTNQRLYRIAHIEVSRGNGKSALASLSALYFLCLDNPNGNQISTVATKREQARIVLDSARSMARKNSSFLKATGTKVLAHAIVHPKSDSMVRALSSEASSLDGLNDVLAVCDELHAMKRDTFEVISSGMSKRTDSLLLAITTAGSDVDSVGHSQSAYAKKVCLGEQLDEQFFAAVYTLDEGDQWDDENVWIKANPNLGVSVDPVTLKAKIDKAMVTPADIPGIRIKHMNEWLSEANAFFDLAKWDACADPTLRLEDFRGQMCCLGLDLASNVDLTSIAILFRKGDTYYLFDKSYLPEATLQSKRNVLYDECVARGFLISTPGEVISHPRIKEDLLSLGRQFRVLEVAFDPWSAQQLSQELAFKLEMVKFAMNTANLSEPMKKLDVLIREGKLRHNGSPLLRWCVGNVVAKEDANANVFPRKSHERLKIDPVVATIMSLGLWLQKSQGESVYDIRGIRTV